MAAGTGLVPSRGSECLLTCSLGPWLLNHPQTRSQCHGDDPWEVRSYLWLGSESRAWLGKSSHFRFPLGFGRSQSVSPVWSLSPPSHLGTCPVSSSRRVSAGEAVPPHPPCCTLSDSHSPRSPADPIWHNGGSAGCLHSHTLQSSSTRAHVSISAKGHRSRAGWGGAEEAGGWEIGVKDCQSPVSVRAGLQSWAKTPWWATPFLASIRGGQRQRGQQSEPSQAKSCPPHWRHFTASFMLNFPAPTIQSDTHAFPTATSLSRLQELSGWPCSLMLRGRRLCPRTKGRVCYFLWWPENLSLWYVKAPRRPPGPCCWCSSRPFFILHFSCCQIAGPQRPNNLDCRKAETCKSAFWSHGKSEKD